MVTTQEGLEEATESVAFVSVSGQQTQLLHARLVEQPNDYIHEVTIYNLASATQARFDAARTIVQDFFMKLRNPEVARGQQPPK